VAWTTRSLSSTRFDSLVKAVERCWRVWSGKRGQSVDLGSSRDLFIYLFIYLLIVTHQHCHAADHRSSALPPTLHDAPDPAAVQGESAPSQHFQVVSLSLLDDNDAANSSSASPSTQRKLSELRFLLRRRQPSVNGGAVLESVHTMNELTVAAVNPLLHDFPPAVLAALLSKGKAK
jgi:hypothetical protein